jgi:hypothetical protein
MTMFVQLLSVPVCSVCDTTIDTLARLIREPWLVTVERLNMAEHPAMLERYGLMSFEYDLLASHATIINGTLAGLDHPSEDTLRLWLGEARALEDMLEVGSLPVDPPGD